MNKNYPILIVSFLFLCCIALNNRNIGNSNQKVTCIDTIDYCDNYQEIRERYHNSHNREYLKTYWCCRIQKYRNHQKDSLTADTCLCRKRLTMLFAEPPPDSFDVFLEPAKKSKHGFFYFSPRNSGDAFYLGGNGKITIDDSCRIIKSELGE